jgi:hypothetical protein
MNLEIISLEKIDTATAKLTIEYDDNFKKRVSQLLNKKSATKIDIEIFVAQHIEQILSEMDEQDF